MNSPHRKIHRHLYFHLNKNCNLIIIFYAVSQSINLWIEHTSDMLWHRFVRWIDAKTGMRRAGNQNWESIWKNSPNLNLLSHEDIQLWLPIALGVFDSHLSKMIQAKLWFESIRFVLWNDKSLSTDAFVFDFSLIVDFNLIFIIIRHSFCKNEKHFSLFGLFPELMFVTSSYLLLSRKIFS